MVNYDTRSNEEMLITQYDASTAVNFGEKIFSNQIVIHSKENNR